MQYLKFLQVLIALGPKLPAIFAALQAFIEAVSAAFPPAEESGSLEVVAYTTAEIEGEIQVAALLAGPNAAFDGSRLRGIFKFLQAHPELLNGIIALLGGLGG